jgi:hypothetical protein
VRSESAAAAVSRRQLFAVAWFGWFPFFKPKQVALDGARFRVIRRGHPHRHYLVIHGNESTAKQVLETYMESHEGVAFLIESKARNVQIASGELDPNRMFSREGAELNLKMLNPQWSYPQVDAALSALDRGREHFLGELLPPHKGLLVALHNNTDEYSVKDEVAISDSVSMRNPDDPHAFFLCTNPADFAALSKSPYNAVLQQKKPQTDDGSLSRLAAQRGVRYVNVEVRDGNMERQTQMLAWLDSNLA